MDVVHSNTTNWLNDYLASNVHYLISVPSLFLCVLSPFEICRLQRSSLHRFNVPLGMIGFLKTLFAVLVLITSIIQTVYASVVEDFVTASDICLIALVIFRDVSLLYVVMLTIYIRSRGQVTSALLFVFWFLELIASVILLIVDFSDGRFKTLSMDVNLAFVILAFFFSCFADKASVHYVTEKISPELLSSCLSRMTFSFCIPLLLHGYKTTLTHDDLWPLTPDVATENSLSVFIKKWTPQLCKHRRLREKLKISLSPSSHECKEDTQFSGVPIESDYLNRSNTPEETDRPQIPRKKNTNFCFVTGALFRGFGREFIFVQLLVAISIAVTFMRPMILRELIRFAYSNSHYELWGYVLVAAMFLSATVTSILSANIGQLSYIIGLKVMGALTAAVYSKTLTISNEARQSSTVGEILNLAEVDAERAMDSCADLWRTWSSLVNIIIGLLMLYNLLGSAMFAGLLVIGAMVPLSAIIAVYITRLEDLVMEKKDERIKLTNELLTGIKVVKLHAWERSFEETIEIVRRQELVYRRNIQFLNCCTMTVWIMAPYIVGLVMFVTYVYTSPDHYLSAETTFVTISIINIIKDSLLDLPVILADMMASFVSFRRLSRYLCHDDLDTTNVIADSLSDHTVKIENGTFEWTHSLGPCLSGINLCIEDKQLVAIVGQVGAGKSSLLSAVLGDLHKLSGSVSSNGSVAYVPQTAWIQNATIRDNILFANEYMAGCYREVIDACGLTSDLEILPAGDLTEIGENGINLSGGQKQRVSVARAVYNDSDIYLLDDPLSALDAHVGKHMFEKVIGHQGLLKNKTRILVTHSVQWLPYVDQIVVVANGRVSAVGTYDQLRNSDSAFSEFLESYENIKNEEISQESQVKEHEADASMITSPYAREMGGTPLSETHEDGGVMVTRRRRNSTVLSTGDMEMGELDEDESVSGGIRGRLVKEELSETGKVHIQVYWTYIKAVGVYSVLLLFSLFCVYDMVSLVADIWLSQWTDNPELNNASVPVNSTLRYDLNVYYMGVYGGLGLMQVIFLVSYSVKMALCNQKSSQNLHDNMLTSILHSPMAFFDTTPTGRIINRFSGDMENIDEHLLWDVTMTLQAMLSAVSTFIILSYTNWLILVVLLPLFGVYYFIMRLFIQSSRQLHRIDSVSHSPVLSVFTECVSGAAVIRAFGVQKRFTREAETLIDKTIRADYCEEILNKCLGVYLNFVGNFIILAVCLFVVIQRESLTPGLVGLSLSSAMSITSTMANLVTRFADLETSVVSVERLKQYSNLESEAEWVKPSHQPPNTWPAFGEVTFNNYQTRYRPQLPLILNELTCSILGGEKVGIVGRTGAGKSSLTLALFRIIEAVGGTILVDGWNIADLGLHDLRQRLTILPQDPVIFSDTVRFNLDPIRVYTDEQIWSSLDLVQLKTYILTLPGSLYHVCSEGGQNFSLGQKQLLCLARALLHKTKILVLDEATAAVDIETDEVIQETIRREFTDCTVLCVAHRLNTVIDYDRILVMDNGRVAEFDTPTNLLAIPNGHFSNMMKA